jgi:hypothetical protein
VKHPQAARAARCSTSGDPRKFAHTGKRRSFLATTSRPFVQVHLAPDAARQTLFKLQSWRDRLPTEAISVPASRLQRLARQIHALGERPLYECLLELESNADLLPTLERYARLAPFAAFIAENGGRDLPKLTLR